jgi:hypothetical protein
VETGGDPTARGGWHRDGRRAGPASPSSSAERTDQRPGAAGTPRSCSREPVLGFALFNVTHGGGRASRPRERPSTSCRRRSTEPASRPRCRSKA